MAKGYQFGAVCYPTLHDVANISCASANGLVSAGYQACTGYSVAGSNIQLQLKIRGQSTHEYTQTIEPAACEYPTFQDTYLPLLSAALPVLALIYIGKKIVSSFNYVSETNS